MKPKKDFLSVLDQVKAVIYEVQPSDLAASTPDSAWTVRDLLRHMLFELSWTPDVLTGSTPEEVANTWDGDLLGSDSVGAWRKAAVAAREAVHRCDPSGIVHLSYGDTTARAYLQEAAVDQLVHAWDLGRAIGVAVVFDDAMAGEMYERMYARRTELVESGLFASPLKVPAHASHQTKLLALLGRSEDWHRPSGN